jgi:hypothetical protein
LDRTAYTRHVGELALTVSSDIESAIGASIVATVGTLCYTLVAVAIAPFIVAIATFIVATAQSTIADAGVRHAIYSSGVSRIARMRVSR